ncbi:hypothetical protein R1T16_05645 [Flavobacterium sp. DG1-102-2]|uniref:hypothetical protein n=1 Tax=Flavobacterium sp. DG1-102-2 TaxID=3081663 RepID=UPI002949224D|nr:hypothetical protein [Flavobacterium sp. DG1-102-2]MDV6167899.1 hypothetical protein [Flavobacterium sp. DG1-102-2]
MIKDSAYIRQFTPEQSKALETIAAEHKINTAKNVLLFALEQYRDNQNEIARLKRFLDMKQKKIEKLTGESPE